MATVSWNLGQHVAHGLLVGIKGGPMFNKLIFLYIYITTRTRLGLPIHLAHHVLYVHLIYYNVFSLLKSKSSGKSEFLTDLPTGDLQQGDAIIPKMTFFLFLVNTQNREGKMFHIHLKGMSPPVTAVKYTLISCHKV